MSQATLGSTPYQNSSLFSGYYLDERIDDLEEWECDEEAEQAFDALQTLWEHEGDLVASYNEDELLGSWIDEVIDILGFGTLSETTLPNSGGYNDRLLFESQKKRRDAAKQKRDGDTEAMYGLASAVLEAKQWDTDFTKRFNEQRSYRDASHQIKYYLERTPERLKWGVLTDGKKWRLYGTKDYATEIYYEIDLPELLEVGDLEQFKYFYAFFRAEAFREVAGTSFLDTVWNESETAAQELGEDLQDNVFTALRVLGEGFLHTNDLAIDPEDEAARAELKEQSLVLLYRLMFVLYAESRGLIHPDNPEKQAEYDEHFSLEEIRLDIHEAVSSGDSYEDYSGYATQIWGKLEDLFSLVDEGQADLGIPPYNGGLFDDDQHGFLADNAVADRYIVEVIHRLGTTSENGGAVLADYADLDTRHLGSIYEGLLEHEFRIAPEQYAAVAADGGQIWKPATEVSVANAVETVEEGELYVVNDEGERKATGAYYTPDYVVSYIVEETVDPLLDDIKTDLTDEGLEPHDREYFVGFWQSVLELKILDPAMGSAHFLTNATGYLTEQVMEVVREQEIQGYDEQYMRRQIAKECIYGVDINGMAVELGKLSMWLETLAADQPLAFLDHHIKSGNSLVGSDITTVLSDDDGTSGQLTLGQAFARARQQTLDHVMDLMQELLAIDNETLDDIKSMEEIYKEIRADPLYQRLFEIANVHTAEEFGLDVPEGVYEQMAGAIEDEAEWDTIRAEDWFIDAQTLADEQQFFHWELEFPEVFFDVDGRKLENAGFDAVAGNPPYVKIQNIRQTNTELADYATAQYSSATGRFDLYGLFVERGAALAKGSSLGYILPNKFFESQAGSGLREFATSNKILRQIVDFGQHQVFDSATTYTCLLFLGDSNSVQYSEVRNLISPANSLKDLEFNKIPVDELESDGWVLTGPMERQAMQKMQDNGDSLGDVSKYISEGIVSGDNEVMFVEVEEWGKEYYIVRSPANDAQYRIEAGLAHPLIDGDEIERYGRTDTDLAVIYPYQTKENSTEEIPEDLLKDKYPNGYEYLSEFKTRLKNRGTESMNYPTWYSLWCPREKQLFESTKLLLPDICQRSEFTIDLDSEMYFPNSAYGLVPQENSEPHLYYLMAVLNSSPTWFYIYHTSPVLRGDFRRFMTSYLSKVPVPRFNLDATLEEFDGVYQTYLEGKEITLPENKQQFLRYLGKENLDHHQSLEKLNLTLLDHLGSYSDGPTLAEIGFTQPPDGAADSILQETAEDKPNLRVGEASIRREGPNTVEIRLTARYKPDDEDAYETDQWGYTETEPLPALRITDLTEGEADLIEAFVPVAVEKAGGFADFRETATKTNSLIDRLQKLTVPVVNDVDDGLENYLETEARAAELDKKIERTDELIDEIVYELYGLTDEEIEIVEEAVDS